MCAFNIFDICIIVSSLLLVDDVFDKLTWSMISFRLCIICFNWLSIFSASPYVRSRSTSACWVYDNICCVLSCASIGFSNSSNSSCWERMKSNSRSSRDCSAFNRSTSLCVSLIFSPFSMSCLSHIFT